MKTLLENWRRFINENEKTGRPAYNLPISIKELRAKVDQFITDTTPQPKGDSLKLKKKLQKAGKFCHPTFGLCFDVSTLLLHMAGGKKYSGLKKMRLKKFDVGPQAPGEKTTHWWLQGKDQEIIDPTAQQFTFGAQPPYDKGRPSDIGFPYFKKGEKAYDEVVPSKTVLKIAKLFKEWNEKTNKENTAYGMDWWIEESAKYKR